MNVTDFEKFMREVHGHDPFPWQSAVVEQTVERGTWPALVDVPTGMGKTSMLDVAVFLLALSAGGEAPAGLGRRRIFLVVDRRIVVDQAEAHGRHIADALEEAVEGEVRFEVAQRLRGLAGDEDHALRVVKMRGGATWDAAWLPRPDLPAIITGTVDQVGSRLFFRGYGVSKGRRPIDAALVGTDSVVMIDEAHLAQAFTTSLASARQADRTCQLGLPEGSVIHLSATSAERPGKDPGAWEASFDEDAHLRNRTAAQRLTAHKRLTFIKSAEKKIVKDMAARVGELVGEPGSRVLAVCNTVARAREVYEALTTGRTKLGEVEVLLLMGRSRPLDREGIAERVTELFGAGREPGDHKAVLVATQTIEVGIDLDATDMVTETASWDALVQRFGRVNRRGDHDSASITVVEDRAKKPPVYGPAKVATAEFLRKIAQNGLDVSPLALRHLQEDVSRDLISPRPLLPLLLPAHLDAWARTNPAPVNDPPLDPYLHGINKAAARITIAWRDGLEIRSGGENAEGDPELLPPDHAGAVVESVPVRSEECIEVSLMAARAWLQQGQSETMADVDDYDAFDDIPFKADDGNANLQALRRGSDDQWRWITARELRPGDTIVVPCEYGGLDRFGWNPSSKEPVKDISELASLRRGQPILRLDSDPGNRLGLPPLEGLRELVADWRNAEEPEDRDACQGALVEAARQWLGSSGAPEYPWTPEDIECLRNAFEHSGALISTGVERRRRNRRRGLSAAGSRELIPVLRGAAPADDWRTVGTSGEHAGGNAASSVPWRAVSEEDQAGTSTLNRRVTLAEHLAAVGERAQQIATNLGLPEELRRVVVDAARWHDLGKVDMRFQAMLFDGSRIAAELAREPLAKSGMPPGERARRRRAQRLSGLPSGARHEAWSEAIVTAHLEGLVEPYPGDVELLRHLVASHHGHARPFLPPVDDRGDGALRAAIGEVAVEVPLPVELHLADADRFARLNHRYGRWGLALLETVVRSADMTISSEGS
ncbi:type I-U CRISPR-associated helicase/endonuclease Cas3 [Actinomyces sp. 565]|uniref:type I-G CRISPR-associated helicase/endonuclease Cas3g n=1 Tax=Actinomyces sp. 565 TaxID=2057794 RepID=UPI0013A6E98A|nr:type I-U CRISPR-associated helicase/endonuclease Cas3 [Actinomyces sp. 565]NDR52549.1 type I-U CRISPR-associated helicase/endonuclease Cas3 [Actinomyces sp. 565]